MPEFGEAKALYFGGDMEAAIPLSGQVAGRIESIEPVAKIISETRDEFLDIIGQLGQQYPA